MSHYDESNDLHDSGDGVQRRMGCTPSGDAKLMAATWQGAGKLVFPRATWKEYDRTNKYIPILDQGSFGSCVGHGSTTALMMDRSYSGMTFQLLSPCFLYGLINGNRDAGANISDAAKSLSDTGTCLESEVPEGMIYQSRFPKSAWDTAKRFRIAESYSLESWDEIISAAIAGYSISLSIRVGGGFNNLDKDGCPPVSRGTGNHCVYMGERLVKSGSEFVLWGRNSWNTNWGKDGRFAIRESHISNQNGFDAFAIRSSLSDPIDPTNPPIAIF